MLCSPGVKFLPSPFLCSAWSLPPSNASSYQSSPRGGNRRTCCREAIIMLIDEVLAGGTYRVTPFRVSSCRQAARGPSQRWNCPVHLRFYNHCASTTIETILIKRTPKESCKVDMKTVCQKHNHLIYNQFMYYSTFPFFFLL